MNPVGIERKNDKRRAKMLQHLSVSTLTEEEKKQIEENEAKFKEMDKQQNERVLGELRESENKLGDIPIGEGLQHNAGFITTENPDGTKTHMKPLELMEKGEKGIKFTDERGKDVDKLTARATDAFSAEVLGFKKEVEDDKAKGFDINDMDSIRAFELDFTPTGTDVLVKMIMEEHKIGSIFLPPGSEQSGKKVIVVETGLYVPYLEKGDIAILKPGATHITRLMIRGIQFGVVDYERVYGIYKSKAVLMERIKKTLAETKGTTE